MGGAVSKEVTIFTGEITIIRKQRGRQIERERESERWQVNMRSEGGGGLGDIFP